MARGYAPVAVVLLLAVTVVAASGVLVLVPSTPGEPAPRRGLAVDASADGRVALTLVTGPRVDVDRLDATVTVDGAPLAHQPPVPFFAATGFGSGPTGPFNVAADSTWRVGETATFRVANTNAPVLRAGDAVEVTLEVRGTVVAVASATVAEPDAENRGRAATVREPSRSLSSRPRPPRRPPLPPPRGPRLRPHRGRARR